VEVGGSVVEDVAEEVLFAKKRPGHLGAEGERSRGVLGDLLLDGDKSVGIETYECVDRLVEEVQEIRERLRCGLDDHGYLSRD
jgi:hypothetical protein